MSEEIISFVKLMVEKGYAFLFFLAFAAVILIALDGTDFNNVFTLQLTFLGKALLLVFVAVAVVGGTWLIIKSSSETNAEKVDNNNLSNESILNYSEEFQKISQEQVTVIQSLRTAIREISRIAQSDRNHATNQILLIIEDLGIAIENYDQETLDAALTVKWIQARASRWLNSFQKNDFPRIKSEEDLRSFKNKIKAYLKILCDNLLQGLMDQEEVQNLNLSQEPAALFLYRDGLKAIREKILREFKSDDLPDLSPSQQKELLEYLDQLIKDIR